MQPCSEIVSHLKYWAFWNYILNKFRWHTLYSISVKSAARSMQAHTLNPCISPQMSTIRNETTSNTPLSIKY